MGILFGKMSLLLILCVCEILERLHNEITEIVIPLNFLVVSLLESEELTNSDIGKEHLASSVH